MLAFSTARAAFRLRSSSISSDGVAPFAAASSCRTRSRASSRSAARSCTSCSSCLVVRCSAVTPASTGWNMRLEASWVGELEEAESIAAAVRRSRSTIGRRRLSTVPSVAQSAAAGASAVSAAAPCLPSSASHMYSMRIGLALRKGSLKPTDARPGVVGRSCCSCCSMAASALGAPDGAYARAESSLGCRQKSSASSASRGVSVSPSSVCRLSSRTRRWR
mmetsp:Transcript_41397/g.90895  ORF Transcript_41397/g.90895 Transcript_41397/m.90895 type:complete len:220 (+) Transcript_41397:316-975(+)